MARTALHASLTLRVFAPQFALRFLANRLMALPVAHGFFAYGLAQRFGGDTAGQAARLAAGDSAVCAVCSCAGRRRTEHIAVWLLALDLAVSGGHLAAGCVAAGWVANRLADSRTLGVVAMPGTVRSTWGYEKPVPSRQQRHRQS